MAGLSPAEIAAPIRSMLSRQSNASVIQGDVQSIDSQNSQVILAERNGQPRKTIEFDYLLLACGAEHSYFGNPEWEEHAPGLKRSNRQRRFVAESFLPSNAPNSRRTRIARSSY